MSARLVALNAKISVNNMADSKATDISSENPEEYYHLDNKVSSSYKTHCNCNLKAQSEHMKSLLKTVATKKT